MLLSFSASAQLYEVSLDLIVDQSSAIIQGEVIDQTSFEHEDGLYTLNLVKVGHSFTPSEISSSEVLIITRGGAAETGFEVWTHLLDLGIGDRGVFFLSEQELVASVFDFGQEGIPVYQVTTSSQGFFKATRSELNNEVQYVNPFLEYRSEQRIVEDVMAVSKDDIIESALAEVNAGKEKDCIKYHILPINSEDESSTSFSFDLGISTTGASKSLYQSTVVFSYDTLIFGSYLASSSSLSISKENLPFSDYNLTIENKAADRMVVTMQGDDAVALVDVNSSIETILSFSLELQQAPTQDMLSYAKEDMYLMNTYLEPGAEKPQVFDCIDIVDGTAECENPVITGIETTASAGDVGAAGVGQSSSNTSPISGVLTISGSNFGIPSSGRPIPIDKKIGFTDAGAKGTDWCYPLPGDYLSWTDNKIEVIIPGIDETSDRNSYAGTGRVLILDTNDDNCSSMSDDNLYVPFAVWSSSKTTIPFPESRRGYLESPLSNGSYELFPKGTIADADPDDPSSSISAIGRAVETWKCGVNAFIDLKSETDVVNQNKAWYVEFTPLLPNGVLSATGRFYKFDEDCSLSNADGEIYLDRGYFLLAEQYRTTPNSPPISINWHTGIVPLGPNNDDLPNVDMETVMLHELGHSLLLLHTLNRPNVMYHSYQGTRRQLHPDDEFGGKHAVNSSASSLNPCGNFSKFTCGSSSTEELKQGQMYYSHNSNSLHFKGDVRLEKVTISNALGQVLFSSPVSNAQLFLPEIPSGTYVATLWSSRGLTESLKFIRR